MPLFLLPLQPLRTLLVPQGKSCFATSRPSPAPHPSASPAPSFPPFPMRPHPRTLSTKQSPPWSPCSPWGLSGPRWQVSGRLQVGVGAGQAAYLSLWGVTLFLSNWTPCLDRGSPSFHVACGRAALHVPRETLHRGGGHRVGCGGGPTQPSPAARVGPGPLQHPFLQALCSPATTLPCTVHPGGREAWSPRSPLPGPAPGTRPPGGSGWGPRMPSSQAPAGPRVWRPQDTCWGLGSSCCTPWPAVGP